MPVKIDQYERQILELLQRDATLSIEELSKRVGLSQSPCWRRIKRLEREGVIKSRVAVLDHLRLGMGVVVFVNVSLTLHGKGSLEEFENEIRKFPEVLECYTVTGVTDYLLKIVTRDIQHYETFVRNHLVAMPMIRELHSTIAVTEIKDTTELPLYSL
jgi:Lrp/AsnC family transcriptional regulator